MSRMRRMVICLLSVVLIAAQMATGMQASAMVMESPTMASEGVAVTTAEEMQGDCNDCGGVDDDLALCPAGCCTSCSTVAAVLPAQVLHGAALNEARDKDAAQLLLGTTPSPNPAPPKHSVLS